MTVSIGSTGNGRVWPVQVPHRLLVRRPLQRCWLAAAFALLGTAAASPEFEQRLLSTPEIQFARALGVNSLRVEGGLATATVTSGARPATYSTAAVQDLFRGTRWPWLAQLATWLGAPELLPFAEGERYPDLANLITASQVKSVPFSAGQVARLASRAEDVLSRSPWLHTISADFQAGQVVVNLAPAHHAAFRRLLGASVPTAALRLGGAPLLHPLSTTGPLPALPKFSGESMTPPSALGLPVPGNAMSIRGRVRPLGGGVRLSAGGLACSAGWVGAKAGVLVLVTAAQCVPPGRTTPVAQPWPGPANTIGAVTNAPRRGLDAVAVPLTTTNVTPEVLAVDLGGQVLWRAAQRGGAASSQAEVILFVGAGGAFRQWIWTVDFNRITVQKQRLRTPGGFLIEGYASCLVVSAKRAAQAQQSFERSPVPGDSGGVLLNERDEVLGHLSTAGPFDAGQSPGQREQGYCYVPWQDVAEQTGMRPLRW